MVATLAVVLALLEPHRFEQEWEEPILTQMEKGYHPCLQFQGGNKFAWTPPGAPVAYGTFGVEGTHYTFTPQDVLELNMADVEKLAAEGVFDLEDFKKQWEIATKPFTADYSPDSGTLTMHLMHNTDVFDYSLQDYRTGDDTVPNSVNDEERKIVGLWREIDKYPNRYDTKTRYRWQGIDGLKAFLEESSQAAGAAFNLLDFRQDKTCRFHKQQRLWWRLENGGFKSLNEATGEQHGYRFDDKGHLVEDGKTVFERVG